MPTRGRLIPAERKHTAAVLYSLIYPPTLPRHSHAFTHPIPPPHPPHPRRTSLRVLSRPLPLHHTERQRAPSTSPSPRSPRARGARSSTRRPAPLSPSEPMGRRRSRRWVPVSSASGAVSPRASSGRGASGAVPCTYDQSSTRIVAATGVRFRIPCVCSVQRNNVDTEMESKLLFTLSSETRHLPVVALDSLTIHH